MRQPEKPGLSKVQEIEERIAELKSRWPKHSVKVAMCQLLEEFEDELEEAKKEEAGGREDRPG